MLAEYQRKPSWDESDSKRRTVYLEKLHRERTKYHAEDLPKVVQAAAEIAAPPDIGDVTQSFAGVAFDSLNEGTPAIDIRFSKSFREMTHETLSQALHDLNELVKVRLGMKACFYLFPAPGISAADTTMRVVCPPEVFVSLLPVEQRATWAEKWHQGDPIQRACGDDWTQLSLAQHRSANAS